MYSEKRDTNNNSFWTVMGVVFTIISIVFTIISIIGFEKFQNTSFCFFESRISIWLLIVIFVVVLFIFLFLGWLFGKRSHLNKEKQNIIKENLAGTDFHNYWQEKIYIPMDITIDSEGNGKRLLLNKHLSSIIKKEQIESKYICLLGDTGSGKTDALVHFLIQYINKYSFLPFKPSNIRLYTMNIGYENLMDRIQEDFPQRRDKKNCIILLDALDECKEAQASLKNNSGNNPSVFMEKLAADTQDFATVVVTCRKQFFIREEFNPDKTSIAVGNPSTLDPFLHWQKLYLAPFNDRQVKKYLAKWFNRHNHNSKSKKEARRIVLSCKDLFLRPMILSHIDIVMKVYGERKEPLSMKDIYDAVVFYWIQREVKNDKIKIDNLLSASLYVASFMYKNDLNYLDEEQYESFCNKYEIEDADHLLRVKSLLNNNKQGYKFSHKSFYEYLLAYWFFLNPDRIDEVGNLDFAMQIYVEIAEAYNFNNYKGWVSEIERRLEIHDLPQNQVAKELGKLAKKLCKNQKFSLAEKCYQEAFYLYLQLVAKNHDTVMPYLAMTLYSLAILHHNTNYKKAEAEYHDALMIWLKLAEKDPDTYLPCVAAIQNRLALLHEQCVFFVPVTYPATLYMMKESNNEYRNKAKTEYQVALIIYRQLAKKTPKTFLPKVAQTLYHIAFIYNKQNDFEKADALARESLSLYHQIAGKDPMRYNEHIKQGLDLIEAIRIGKQRGVTPKNKL